MTIWKPMVALVAALAVSACVSPDQYGNGSGGANGSGTGFDPATAGTASDPTSPAYFAEAIGDRILFPVDQHTLTDVARNTLSAQARWLMTNGSYSAIVEGHADERGTREYNVALGARRASAVQNYLIEQGVAPGRLTTVSYGKERPLEVCSDEGCYSNNRRAVTVITAGQTS